MKTAAPATGVLSQVATAMRDLALNTEFGEPGLTGQGEAMRRYLTAHVGAEAEDDPMVALGVTRLADLIGRVFWARDFRPAALVRASLLVIGLEGEDGLGGIATDAALEMQCGLLALAAMVGPDHFSPSNERR